MTDYRKHKNIYYYILYSIVTVYCTCKIAKDSFRIVLYVTTFYMQHCAVACFVLEQWIVHNYVYVADMYKVELKDRVFVLGISKLKWL